MKVRANRVTDGLSWPTVYLPTEGGTSEVEGERERERERDRTAGQNVVKLTIFGRNQPKKVKIDLFLTLTISPVFNHFGQFQPCTVEIDSHS